MQSIALYVLAAFFELAGCFAVWGWWKLDKSALWLIPAGVSLAAFAWTLAMVDVDYAGRAFAVYGGIYIVASLAWLWLVEGSRPDRWDLTGMILCLIGAAVILFGRRSG